MIYVNVNNVNILCIIDFPGILENCILLLLFYDNVLTIDEDDVTQSVNQLPLLMYYEVNGT